MGFPKSSAIWVPTILPEKMAAEASAISLASPAANTGKPTSFALRVNSFTGSSPIAMSSVSQENCFSVPGIGWKCWSTWAITTFSM